MKERTPKRNENEYKKVNHRIDGIRIGCDVEVPMIEVFSRQEVNRLEFLKKKVVPLDR